MEYKKATVLINADFEYPIEEKVFNRVRYQRLSSFIKTVRLYAFTKILSLEYSGAYATIIFEGDIGKEYDKITRNDALRSNDFSNLKLKQLRAYRHEPRETEVK